MSDAPYDWSRSRFREILTGRAREDLADRIRKGQYKFRIGDGTVEIPFPSIEMPELVHVDPYDEGVGEGPGDIGDVIDTEPGDEDASGDQKSGEHVVTVDERAVAEMLMEHLELPRIQPKQGGQI